jgi:hypothetical protein
MKINLQITINYISLLKIEFEIDKIIRPTRVNMSKCVLCSFTSGRSCSEFICFGYQLFGACTIEQKKIFTPLWKAHRYNLYVIKNSDGSISRPTTREEFLFNINRLLVDLEETIDFDNLTGCIFDLEI